MPEKAQNARKEMEKTHKTIVALGGGEIKSKTTLKIDEYVASLAYKRAGGRRPAGLFLGTASHDSMPYFNSFRKTYTSVFDIKADVALTVYGEMDLPHIEEKFLKADFLYIGGGDTKFMLDSWKETGLIGLVLDAYDRGVPVAGLSAGAICWFDKMYTDFDIIRGQSNEYKMLDGLGILRGTVCPHYDDRREDFLRAFAAGGFESAVALENNAALGFDGRPRLFFNPQRRGNRGKGAFNLNQTVIYGESKMEKKKTFYITTPLYYSSGKLHLGHCYTTVICDSVARFKRMEGRDVFFLTGTDEHGQNIARRAAEKGMQPKEYVDALYADIKKLWELMDISYDKFIRTTDDYHEQAVKEIFTRLYEKGDIYKAEYEGWYCSPCESFWTEAQLVDGKCPDCGREVARAKEESYFFRLSKYADRISEYYQSHPDFLLPHSRVNEMLNNFIKPGLNDLCVSRSSVKWGVPVPFDEKHSIYVWVDALSNYITALGYAGGDESLFEKYWPADVHMMAKEIVRFHSIIWPAILMALDLPLPKQVYGHGWLLFDGDKMSKSKGNVVDPYVLCERYGLDAVRYYLLRDVPFGNDGVYSLAALLNRSNADLCNSLGNLVSRTAAMITQYFGGKMPAPVCPSAEQDEELKAMTNALCERVGECVDALNLPDALAEIFKLINRANKYIDETTPWLLAKDESKRDRLGTVLYNLAEAIRVCAVMLTPFLKNTAEKILAKFSLKLPQDFSDARFGVLKEGTEVVKGENLFNRIDVNKELKEMERL